MRKKKKKNWEDITMKRGRRVTSSLVLITFFYLSYMIFLPSPKSTEPKHEIINKPHKSVVYGSPSLNAPMVIAVCQSVTGREASSTSSTVTLNERVRSWSRQAEQLTTMLKTLLYFTKSPLWHIIVMTDTLDTFNKVLNLTANLPRRRLLLQHRPIWLPRDEPVIKRHWRPCAWAKQFMAEALPDQDSAVYVDTDVVFLGPAEELWWLLHSMGPRQALALAPEPQYLLDTPKRPFAGTVGLNTGVMVANLTRLRRLPGGGLGSAILDFGVITPPPRHDQDALNHYLLHKPHLLLEVTSRWNFSPTCCFREAPPCEDCLSAGILVLHGSEATFFRNIDRKFLLVYATMAALKLEDSPRLLLEGLAWRLAMLDTWSHDYICSNYTNFNQGLILALNEAAIK